MAETFNGPHVSITVDSAGNFSVGPDPARPKKHLDEQVLWQNNTGLDNVTVAFTGQSPFAPNYSWTLSKNQTKPSGKVTVPPDPTHDYKYKVSCPGHPDLDPHVIVDP